MENFIAGLYNTLKGLFYFDLCELGQVLGLIIIGSILGLIVLALIGAVVLFLA